MQILKIVILLAVLLTLIGYISYSHRGQKMDRNEAACRTIGIKPRMTVISPFMMKLAGLFIPEARASVEMMYEFTEPFEVESDRMQRAFSLEPTPVETVIER